MSHKPDPEPKPLMAEGILLRGLKTVFKHYPVSFYLLCAVPIVLLLSHRFFLSKDDPKQLFWGLVLLLIFFAILVLRAIMDASELLFRQYKASQEVFQETLGEEDFARKLGERVKAEASDAEEEGS